MIIGILLLFTILCWIAGFRLRDAPSKSLAFILGGILYSIAYIILFG